MRIEVLDDAEAACQHAAELIAAAARKAVAARGRFVLALSGGATPRPMYRALGREELPWPAVQIVQVDERVAPADNPDRNLLHIRENLLQGSPIRADQIHGMPVERPDIGTAADEYARTLQELCGSPPVIDLVHLGIGDDGHTASLVPGDPVLQVTDVDVAPSGPYQGRQRLTITYPMINRARDILWLIAGAEKADMLVRLRDGDPSIPAGRVRQTGALVLADRAAASKMK